MPRHPATVIAALLATASLAAQDAPLPLDDATAAVLERSAAVWPRLPRGWNDGAFTGNGNLGTILWQADDGRLRFEISRMDLYDHRGPEQAGGMLFRHYRLPNGNLSMRWGATPVDGQLRLDLARAEINGRMTSDVGVLDIRIRTHAIRPIIQIDTKVLSGGDAPEWSWHAEAAKSPRTRKVPAGLTAYPPPLLRQHGQVSVSIQEQPEDAATGTLGAGAGQYATAWATAERGGGRRTTFVSLAHSHPGRTAAEAAAAAVGEALAADAALLDREHLDWWTEHWRRSLVSLPDARLESFYTLQIYKMGSALRGGGPLLDLLGPWYQPTVWPAIWWNLNLQMAYSPFPVAGQLEAADTLLDHLWRGRDQLARNAGPGPAGRLAIGRATGPALEEAVGREIGNLPWVMHNLWERYRMTMDDGRLRERILPLMHGTFRHLDHLLQPAEGDRLTLPPCASPEYAEHAADCSYALASLRWLARTIITAEERLGLDDGLAGRCRVVLDRLVPYPVGPSGYLIGRDLPLKSSHRHWSHLFMIHPFAEIALDDPVHGPLARRSVEHWLSMPQEFTGFSYAAAASIAARAGDGEAAVRHLDGLFAFGGLLSNTLTRETGPVIETALGGARAVQDLLLRSDGSVIEVFPAVPAAWAEALFTGLCAEGGFRVDARRQSGATVLVRITSLAGEPCRVRTRLPPPISCRSGHRVQTDADGITSIELPRGATAELVGTATRDIGPLRAVAITRPASGPWGLGKPAAQDAADRR
jgi:alpha-L-fucosidase 2